MDRQYDQVKAFHAACSVDMPEKPQILQRTTSDYSELSLDVAAESLEKIMKVMRMNKGDVNNRASFILEELVEFMRADTLEDQVDALTDAMYFIIGTFTLIGVRPEAIFDIVHAANMGKVGPDGKVIRDANGKIRKPEGWQQKYAPESKIIVEILRQGA